MDGGRGEKEECELHCFEREDGDHVFLKKKGNCPGSAAGEIDQREMARTVFRAGGMYFLL